ncbi:hypothetical protein ACWIGE_19010, partial [Streptomyces diastaticus]
MHHLIPAPRTHTAEDAPEARLALGPDTALRSGAGTGTAARWLGGGRGREHKKGSINNPNTKGKATQNTGKTPRAV